MRGGQRSVEMLTYPEYSSSSKLFHFIWNGVSTFWSKSRISGTWTWFSNQRM